jgi:hypothetical protein
VQGAASIISLNHSAQSTIIGLEIVLALVQITPLARRS